MASQGDQSVWAMLRALIVPPRTRIGQPGNSQHDLDSDSVAG
jgi:hypothetical protein